MLLYRCLISWQQQKHTHHDREQVMDKWRHIATEEHKRRSSGKRINHNHPSEKAGEDARRDKRRPIHERGKKGQRRVDLEDSSLPEAQLLIERRNDVCSDGFLCRPVLDALTERHSNEKKASSQGLRDQAPGRAGAIASLAQDRRETSKPQEHYH